MVEQTTIDSAELRAAWFILSSEDRIAGFRMLDTEAAEEFFYDLSPRDQLELALAMPTAERRLWLRLLAPDDAADLIQEAEPEQRGQLLALLDEQTRKEVIALLAYEEDQAGGLMSSRFARVRPGMRVDEAIAYLRRQAVSSIEPETIYYVYVLDANQRLEGVISFRDLFSAPSDRIVSNVMSTDVIAVPESMDQEAVARLFAEHDLLAIPVVGAGRVLKGIVTVDDIVNVVEEEATEDIQKYGGMEALEAPYLRTPLPTLVRKRGGWLVLLFFAQLLTAEVITHFEAEISDLAALAIFIPLILSSGGNSGSQASTLVIRAITVGELRLRDWWRVARRELAAGATMGAGLGLLGFLRVLAASLFGVDYATESLLLALTIAGSLIAVVVWGTIVGSMLPFLLQRAGFDPASASAPLVATVSDVTGLLIYFSIATVLVF